ncbi:MAG: GxxExxY protein [Verrucomicrobiales bacterium]|jgi:GxxExxY protein|nr:GxxExxY protein [Verrucomicrobiales bacterium]
MFAKTKVTPLNPEIEQIAAHVVDSAFQVHSKLGPGLLESIYEKCLMLELNKRKVAVANQLSLPVYYDGKPIDCDYRMDLLVEKKLIIEIKAVETLLPIHKAQLLTYLKLTQLRLGFLINFNVPVIRQGIKRVIL